MKSEAENFPIWKIGNTLERERTDREGGGGKIRGGERFCIWLEPWIALPVPGSGGHAKSLFLHAKQCRHHYVCTPRLPKRKIVDWYRCVEMCIHVLRPRYSSGFSSQWSTP